MVAAQLATPGPILHDSCESLANLDPDLESKYFGPHTGARIGTMPSPSSGVALRTYHWPAATDTPRGLIIAVHGHGTYTVFEFLRSQGVNKPHVYSGSWVEQLNQAGFAVAAIDHQSHGASEGIHGLRCYFQRFDDLALDVAVFAREMRCTKQYVGTPMFIMGESMGGGLATAIVQQHPDMFQGCILLAPMLSLQKVSSKGINPYLRPIATLLSMIGPTWQLVHTEKSPLEDEVRQTFDADPLTYSQPTRVRVAQEYLIATENIQKRMHAVTVPLLIFHSELDTMCDADGSKQLYLAAKSPDKTLRLVNDMWHALVKEFHNDDILQQAIEWLQQRS